MAKIVSKNMITQIASLPYNSIDKAIAYSLKHDIPFIPELPALGDEMSNAYLNPGKSSCLNEFKRQCKKHKLKRVKGQVMGPASALSDLLRADESIGRNEAEALVLNNISRHADIILDGLEAEEVILFLDEPSLGNIGFDFLPYWEAIFSGLDVTKGVHVCGSMDWDKMFNAEIDIISFNASAYDITLSKEFEGRNKRIAWGIESLDDIKTFQKGDLITPPCGLGGMNLKTGKRYTEEDCEEVFNLLKSYR